MTYNASEFIKAIPKTGGNITKIAKKMGCDWHTVNNAIKKHPTVNRAWKDEREKVNDAAEDVLVTAIVKDKDKSTAKWWLIRMRKDDFSERMELTGADGGELVPLGTTIDERIKNVIDILGKK